MGKQWDRTKLRPGYFCPENPGRMMGKQWDNNGITMGTLF
jgi:hypothetical protein